MAKPIVLAAFAGGVTLMSSVAALAAPGWETVTDLQAALDQRWADSPKIMSNNNVPDEKFGGRGAAPAFGDAMGVKTAPAAAGTADRS